MHNPGSRVSLLHQAGRLAEDSQNLVSDGFKFMTLGNGISLSEAWFHQQDIGVTLIVPNLIGDYED